jgi:hypothetical protein
MRRILFTMLACTALFVAVPTAALAHHGRHHHKRHHHARIRHETFIGRHDASGTAGSPSDTTEPTAGTVTSFANNVLTITLTNGSKVSGDVTNDTEVNCEGPDNSDNGVEQDDMVRDNGPTGGDEGDQGDDNDDQGDQAEDNDTCTLTPGMAVRKAELKIDGSGASWEEVELISSSTTSTTQP